MSIKVEVNYLEHEGGTKFYETVLLYDGSGKAMLLKRYGKIELARQGKGEVIIARGDLSTMRKDERDILLEKTSNKKGYKPSRSMTGGLHKINTNEVAFMELIRAAREHYKKPEPIDAIAIYYDGTGANIPAAPTAKPEPVFDPTIDRGELWGAF